VYNLVLVAVALGIAVFADAAVGLVAGPEFRDAASMVPALCLAMVFFSYRQIGQIGALIRGRSDRIAVATTTAAVVATGLNFLLIPSYGAHGAAWATAVAFGVEFLIMWNLSQRLLRLPLTLAEIGVPAALAIGAWVVTWWATPADWSAPLQLAVQALCFAAFLLVCWTSGLVPAEQRAAMVAALADPRQALRRLRSA
jgi:O-antigen/teichoic acid export membrane protein